MNDYEALRDELERMGSSYVNYAAAVDRYAEVVNEQVAALWSDNAELRDELHAVANRLEALTRAITTSPAEVAAAIVNDANRSTLREVASHDAGSPLYREERDRYLIECSCGWEYEGRTSADAEIAYRRHTGEYAA